MAEQREGDQLLATIQRLFPERQQFLILKFSPWIVQR
jgi:hypothetical protein